MSLPIAPTDATRRRLLLAKALYQSALSSSTAPLRSHRRIIGVVSLDLANETLLKAVCWELGQGQQPERKFQGLLDTAGDMVAKAGEVRTLPRPPLPGEAGAREVHEVRNDAQHRGRAPAEDVLAECRAHTRAFQAGVIETVWGLAFETLADSGAIEEPTCRARLEEAEAALLSGDFLGAARAASAGLSRASSLATKDQREDIGLRMRHLAAFGTVDREADALRGRVRQLTLGLDRAMQDRLARLTGDHWVSLSAVNWLEPDETIDQEGAEWAVAYCTEQIVGIEERFGIPDARPPNG